MTERETFTSALAGPLAKARATSAGVAPCAPTPGRSRIDCGSARRASPIARGCVAAAGGEEGLDRIAAEVRVDGQRVGERRALVVAFQVGGGIGARGRADVA